MEKQSTDVGRITLGELIREWKMDVFDIIFYGIEGEEKILELEGYSHSFKKWFRFSSDSLKRAYIARPHLIGFAEYDVFHDRDIWGDLKYDHSPKAIIGKMKPTELAIKLEDKKAFEAKYFRDGEIAKQPEKDTIDSIHMENFEVINDYATVEYKQATYTFTTTQSLVIKILHEFSEKGKKFVKQKIIFDQAKIKTYGMQMTSLFKNHPAMGTLIIRSDRACYGLNI
ncbi:MAG: hypothetical protein HQK49_13275 [Oligoflexia bacterium]|nr:hypothetical protein [Oligoflexia bacterium]